MKDIFEEMAAKWSSSVVSRDQVGEFTGGLVAPGTVANADSRGEGPDCQIRLGKRKVGYPVVNFVDWLRGRAEIRHRGGKK